MAGRSIQVRLPVFTNGSSTGLFIPFVTMPVYPYSRARLSIVCEGSSGDLRVETCGRYADDYAGFPGAAVVDFPTTGSPNTLNSDGQSTGASYRDLDSARKLVQFGIQASDPVGASQQMGVVTLTCDFLE